MTNSPDGLLNALSQNGFDRILNSKKDSVDLKQIYKESGILYVSLGSLVNRLRAVSVGKLLLSELTSLSSLIYNKDESVCSSIDKRVNIFVDEAGEIITPELVMLLNKSRGANFALTLATQSYADLCMDAGEYTASKILDNCNNLICCRVNSEQTAMLISRLTGNSRKNVHSRGYSQSSDNENLLSGFNQSHSVRDADCALFPYDAIMRLPNFEYIAKLSDGRLIKGVFPYLEMIDAKKIIKEISENQRQKNTFDKDKKDSNSSSASTTPDSDIYNSLDTDVVKASSSNTCSSKYHSKQIDSSSDLLSDKTQRFTELAQNENAFFNASDRINDFTSLQKSEFSQNGSKLFEPDLKVKTKKSKDILNSSNKDMPSDIDKDSVLNDEDCIDDILLDSDENNFFDYENDFFSGKRSAEDEKIIKEYLSGIYSKYLKK